MIPRLAFALIASITTLVLATGCSSNYVNVPTLDGSPASQDPNLVVVRRIEVEALNHVLRRYPPGPSYAIELPPGTDAPTYWWVLRKLPEGGQQLDQLPDDMEVPPLYRVAQVVVRGMVAQVEVVVPPGGIYDHDRLVSVFLSPDMNGWYANRSRMWRIPADQALRIVRETHVEAGPEERVDPDALDQTEEAAEPE
ncbi:MAG: hypothetical protein WD294_12335 [Phycisphaeraceae bacterium]